MEFQSIVQKTEIEKNPLSTMSIFVNSLSPCRARQALKTENCCIVFGVTSILSHTKCLDLEQAQLHRISKNLLPYISNKENCNVIKYVSANHRRAGHKQCQQLGGGRGRGIWSKLPIWGRSVCQKFRKNTFLFMAWMVPNVGTRFL